jgi:hypothetical protein
MNYNLALKKFQEFHNQLQPLKATNGLTDVTVTGMYNKCKDLIDTHDELTAHSFSSQLQSIQLDNTKGINHQKIVELSELVLNIIADLKTKTDKEVKIRSEERLLISIKWEELKNQNDILLFTNQELKKDLANLEGQFFVEQKVTSTIKEQLNVALKSSYKKSFYILLYFSLTYLILLESFSANSSSGMM